MFGGTWGEGFKLKELKADFDSEAFVKAGNWLHDLIPYAPPGIMTGQGTETFGTSENNVAINLRVAPHDYHTTTVLDDTKGRYGIAYLFVNKDKGMGGMFAGSPYAIDKTSDNKDLAWEYLKFMGSDFYQKWQWENYQSLPAMKSATNWADFKEDKGMGIILDSMRYLWTPRYPYRAAQPRGILTDAVEKFMLDKESIEDALKSAQVETDKWVQSLNK